MRTVASELAKVGAESFWGPCVEEPQVCGMICGWESMEVRQLLFTGRGRWNEEKGVKEQTLLTKIV